MEGQSLPLTTTTKSYFILDYAEDIRIFVTILNQCNTSCSYFYFLLCYVTEALLLFAYTFVVEIALSNSCFSTLLATPGNQPLQHSLKICLFLRTDTIAAEFPVYNLLQFQPFNNFVHTQFVLEVRLVRKH